MSEKRAREKAVAVDVSASRMDGVRFYGRPGGSPALAALLAARVLKPESVVLDLCCGKGVDSMLLARGGVSSVLGVDGDRDAVRFARDRAEQNGLSCRFRPMNLPKDLWQLHEGSYDAVIDTLGSHNVFTSDRGVNRRREKQLVAALAHLLKDDGLWIGHFRHRHDDEVTARKVFPVGTAEHFTLGPVHRTHLAEFHEEELSSVEQDFADNYMAIAYVQFGIATRKPRRAPRARP